MVQSLLLQLSEQMFWCGNLALALESRTGEGGETMDGMRAGGGEDRVIAAGCVVSSSYGPAKDRVLGGESPVVVVMAMVSKKFIYHSHLQQEIHPVPRLEVQVCKWEIFYEGKLSYGIHLHVLPRRWNCVKDVALNLKLLALVA